MSVLRDSELRRSLGSTFIDSEVARLYRYRPPYPSEVFEILANLIVSPRTVLDAGAGSGALARRMMDFADRIDAVDPSGAMIAEGRALSGGDDARIRWIVGRAEDAPLDPPYGLITCGASLHWMDLDVVLPRFRDALAPGAFVAIVDMEERLDPAVRDDVVKVIQAVSEVRKHAGTRDLVEEISKSGRFRVHGERSTSPTRFDQSIDEYLGRLHSSSTLSRARLGARSAIFDEQIHSVFRSCGIDRVQFDITGYVTWGTPT